MGADDEIKKKKRKRSKKNKDDDDDDDVVDENIAPPQDDVEKDVVSLKHDEVKQDDDNNNENDEEQEGDGNKEGDGEIDDPDKPKRKRKRKRKTKKTEEENADNAPPDEQQLKMTSLDHTVYVEGIPFDCTEEDVKQWFVTHECADIIQMRLSRWQDTGRLRGYGHVVFNTTESREKAILELNGKNLGKRYLNIIAPKAPKENTTMSASVGTTPRDQPAGCSVVFVKNLPYHATEEDITESFQVCGKILDGGVRVARNSATRQSKGFAYVEYKNPEGAQGAVKKAAKPFGMKVLDRPVFVDYDEGRMKGSYKTEDGKLWSKEFKKR